MFAVMVIFNGKNLSSAALVGNAVVEIPSWCYLQPKIGTNLCWRVNNQVSLFMRYIYYVLVSNP